MNDHHVLQHLALLLLIIPALAITNPPYSSPNVPFIETGITNIITAAKGAGCGSWKGTTAPHRISSSQIRCQLWHIVEPSKFQWRKGLNKIYEVCLYQDYQQSWCQMDDSIQFRCLQYKPSIVSICHQKKLIAASVLSGQYNLPSWS